MTGAEIRDLTPAALFSDGPVALLVGENSG